jgi:VIT1/CCC1 family predicted Fe2+/Mn2+ transporter
MKTSTQFIGVLVVMAVIFGVVPFVPADNPTRAMLAAFVIVLAGGTMAFLRARKMGNRR